MQSTTTTVTASDGTGLHTHRWLPDGAAEGRRADRARHGRALGPLRAARPRRSRPRATPCTPTTTAATAHGQHGRPGYFADHDGWDAVVADLRARHRLRPRGEPRAAGLPLRPQHGLVPRAGLRHRGRPRARRASCSPARPATPALLGKVGARGRAHRGPAARPAPRQHAARQAHLRPVQRGVQAQPHRLRLALPRRGRGRQVRRRPAVRQHLHHAASSSTCSAACAAHQRPPPGGPGPQATCRSTSSPGRGPGRRQAARASEQVADAVPAGSACSDVTVSSTRAPATRSSTRPTATRSPPTSSTGSTPTSRPDPPPSHKARGGTAGCREPRIGLTRHPWQAGTRHPPDAVSPAPEHEDPPDACVASPATTDSRPTTPCWSG